MLWLVVQAGFVILCGEVLTVDFLEAVRFTGYQFTMKRVFGES